MEPSEPLYNQLKIYSLKNIFLNSFLFVFDKLANNLPDVFDQFFKLFKELHTLTSTPGWSQQYLMFLKLILKCLVLIQ